MAENSTPPFSHTNDTNTMSADGFTPLSPMHKEMLRIFKDASIVGGDIAEVEVIDNEAEGNGVDEALPPPSRGVVREIITMLQAKLTAYFELVSIAASLITPAMKEKLLNMIPELVVKVVTELVPAVGVLAEGFKEAVSCVSKTLTHMKTEHVAQHGTSQVATDVLERVRSQIAKAARKNGFISVAKTGMVVVDLTTAGVAATVTGVVKVVMLVFAFLTAQYDKMVMKRLYSQFQLECGRRYSTAETQDDTEFRTWLLAEMKKIPVLASYIINMPIFSSPFNFLDIPKIEAPKKLTLKQKFVGLIGVSPEDKKAAYQAKVIEDYRKLQKEGKQFISESPVILESKEPGAKQYLRAARGEPNYIPGQEPEEDAAGTAKQLAKVASLVVVKGAAHSAVSLVK